MTPEEVKARDLVKSFRPYMYCYSGSEMLSNDYNLKVATDNAKECASISVDEIISALIKTGGKYNQQYENALNDDILFYEKVKEAINKI